MSIPRDQLQRVVDAGHPDTAIVGIPVSLVREFLRHLPVETILARAPVAAPTGGTA
jgi:hypothetical protein